MRPMRGWMLPLLSVAIAACGDAEPDPVPATPAADDTAYGARSKVGVSEPPVPQDPAATPLHLELRPIGEPVMAGQVDLEPRAEGTRLTVSLHSAAGLATTHAGYLHRGSCADPGEAVEPLQPITLSNGRGLASTVTDLPLERLTDGRHSIAYHRDSGSDPGPPIVCGEIPGRGTTAPT